MNDIDLSNEALLAHRAIAEKATPSFIQEGLSIYGPLHPESKHPNGRIFVAKVAEGSNRRDPHLFDGAGVGSGPADAAHIAANSPNVVIAHVDEILRLRNDLAATECREGEGDAYVEQLCLERDDLEAEVARLEREVERLNQEADYLAGVIAAAYCAQENVTHCEKTEGLPLLKLRDACAACWREAARKAVEVKA